MKPLLKKINSQQFVTAVKNSSVNLKIMLASLLIAFLVSLFFLRLDILVHAKGYLQIKFKNIMLEHATGGTISKLLVHEGQHVEKGQLLAIIDNSYVSQEYTKNTGSIAMLQLQATRLNAEINQKPFIWENINIKGVTQAMFLTEKNVYDSEIDTYEQNEKLAKNSYQEKLDEIKANTIDIEGLKKQKQLISDQVKIIKDLVKEEAASKSALLNQEAEEQKILNQLNTAISRQELLKSQAYEAQLKVTKIHTDFMSDKRNKLLQLEQQLAELKAKQTGISDRKKIENVFSPTNGIIQSIFKSNAGAFIPSGGKLFEISPDNVPIICVLKVSPSDRDKLWVGMPVKIAINSISTIGANFLSGTVSLISADTKDDNINGNKRPYFEVDVDLNEQDIHNQHIKIYPGMQVDGYIIVGKRTVAQYILKPMLTGANTALTEV
ncbi:HlyD family type I secretion periplasmic adaptor subunit [Cysteiniphilum sp. 6C5]|uniref:HlyD family type I secretion periplasmic adaptor subunit n=1 Tax=unclassified Cysteiniphilum TaxID=2610889 RepID=UPI003F87E71D